MSKFQICSYFYIYKNDIVFIYLLKKKKKLLMQLRKAKVYETDRRTCERRLNDEICDFRGGQGVRCLGMLGRTTVGKAGGDGGLGWADCWRWRRPFPVLLPRFRVPRPIRKRSVSTMTCCRTTTASSALLATTAIASLSKWDYASPSSSTLWVESYLLSGIPKHYSRPVWMALETIELRCVCVCV